MERVERLVGDARARQPRSMDPRERAVVLGLAASYVVAAVAIAFLLPWERSPDALLVAAFVVMFAVVSRIEFEIGSTTAVAIQLVFVPMLFVLPLPLVPLLVPLAYLIDRTVDFAQGNVHPDRWPYVFSDSWFTIGPVVVLGLLVPGPPHLDHLDIYLFALLAQFATDFFALAIGGRLARGVTLIQSLSEAVWIYRIDAILSPIAFMAADEAYQEPAALVGVVPLVWLLHTFARERKERYTGALELNRAYRGTVMLLSDVVEADDSYTADHCRSVVSLVNAVADELGIDADARQELEFAALLHDVGKIVIPKEILNKPGPLTDEEFALMKTHTIEGQVLLNRVGGLLGRVGQIVRSCHERWDGSGYPDGLSGYDIPLEARIVFCCDAYSAMTTDRPYRAAMSEETALEELWGNAGTQFDPRVVAALAEVLRRGDGFEPESHGDLRTVLASQQLPARVEAPGR
jgi:HD-GYP domain-containing protein (c-di-GMP phosphodiesterase class II)